MKKVTSNDANSIECQDGSVRSLALKAAPVFTKLEIGGDNPKKEAWDFAKSVKDEFGSEFTQDDARKHFTKVYVKGEAINKEETATKPQNMISAKISSRKLAKDFDKEAKGVVASNISKNEKIRRLLEGNYGISQVASSLGLKYQRVKNIKKMEDEKKAKELLKSGKSVDKVSKSIGISIDKIKKINSAMEK